MNKTNKSIDYFCAAMRNAGLEPPVEGIIPDGQIHRFHISGDKQNTKNGVYKLNIIGFKPAGYFKDHKWGDGAKGIYWKSDQPAKPLTKVDRKQIEVAQKNKEIEQELRYEKAHIKAVNLLKAAKPCLGNDHPYLKKKGVESFGLYRLKVWHKRYKNEEGEWLSCDVSDVLLIPLTDLYGKIWSVQALLAEPHPLTGSTKDFLSGGKTSNVFHAIGQATEKIIICEGYATGASLHKATGLMVLCAMSASNLIKVAQDVRILYPDKPIIIAADNDDTKAVNAGLIAAKKAAFSVRGLLAVPPISGDFNDMDLANREVVTHE